MTARWTLQRLVGRGRHANVWLAGDSQGGPAVALKVARTRMTQEWEALRALACKQVPKAFDHGTLADGRSYLALEYCSGGPFARTLPMTSDAVESLLHDAASALAAIHAQGWVHRDVKPAHFLARGDGSHVLCDFGSACRTGAGRRAGEPAVTGTPRYAAPEQTQGAPAQPSADVYSLGVCVYELLTGKAPFSGETLIEVFSQHVRAPAPRLPARLGAWQPLLDAMLAKDPQERPSDGAAVLAFARDVIGAVHE